jgi:hypothetical protein
MPDRAQQHTDPLAAALIEAQIWRELTIEAQELLDPLLNKIHEQQQEMEELRARLHDANEYALRLQYRWDRHDCS